MENEPIYRPEFDSDGVNCEKLYPHQVQGLRLDYLRRSAELLQECDNCLDSWKEKFECNEKYHRRIALATCYIRLAECWDNLIDY